MLISTISSLLLLSIGAIAAQKPTCSKQYRRKEIRSLIVNGRLNQEGQNFLDGVRCLANRRGQSGGTIHDDFTQAHLNVADTAHGAPEFFPWHRLFLFAYEKAMRECTGNQDIYIPYWQATLDSQSPERSPVFKVVGRNGRLSVLNQSPFGRIYARYDSNRVRPHTVRRQFSDSSLLSPEGLSRLFRQEGDSYSDFYEAIENRYHGPVHVWVSGDMLEMSSPNDPIFYMHHAYVDKIWAQWQSRNPRLAKTYNGGRARSTDRISVNPVSRYLGVTGPITVADLFSTSDWCYTYSFGVTGITNERSLINRSFRSKNSKKIEEEFEDEDEQEGGEEQEGEVQGDDEGEDQQSEEGGEQPEKQQNEEGGEQRDGEKEVVEEPQNEEGGEQRDGEKEVVEEPQSRPTKGSPFNPKTPPSIDRVDEFNIRKGITLPDSFIKMNHLNPKKCRKYERDTAEYVDFVNKISGYVSPCALNKVKKISNYRDQTEQEWKNRQLVEDLIYSRFLKSKKSGSSGSSSKSTGAK